MTPAEYWRSGAGLENITPQGKAWPEGEGFASVLVDMVGDASVLEIGCGTGRLAGLFGPERYVGLDICPKAVQIAREAVPTHRFIEMPPWFPSSDVTLLHTVLLHVSDDDLGPFLSRLRSTRVLVSEILGRKWRREGDPPVFNREASDYQVAFSPRYELRRTVTHPYPHYHDTDLTILEFSMKGAPPCSPLPAS